MIWFKTRHEVKQLRTELVELREMLRAHFDIKYTFQDFQEWFDAHPHDGAMPTSVGEFLHYYSMLDPAIKIFYRGVELSPKEVTDHVK